MRGMGWSEGRSEEEGGVRSSGVDRWGVRDKVRGARDRRWKVGVRERGRVRRRGEE